MPFCDWFSGFVNYDFPDWHDGRVIQIRASGEIDYETLKPMQIKGSFDDNITVKSCPIPATEEYSLSRIEATWRVYISGNPTKFLQGHNVYGHADMIGVIRDFIRIVLDKLGLDVFTINRIMKDPIQVTRIDVTQGYLMDSNKDVTEWLRSCSQFMTGKNQKVDTGATLYVGKHSRRVSIKVYNKAVEMLAHKKTFNLSDEIFDKLHCVASRLLRFEVTLRGMKLRDLGLDFLGKATNEMYERDYHRAIEKMNLPENLELIKNDVHALPPQYSGVYHAWLSGIDIKETMSRTSYYRYRKFFLEKFNLDLSMPPRDISYSSIIPLWQVIRVGAEYNPLEDDENLYIPSGK